MKRTSKPKIDARTRSHPNRRHPDTWDRKLQRALRDGRGAILTAAQVKELCWLHDLPPAPITPYLRQRLTITTIKADEDVSITHMRKIVDRSTPSAAVARKHKTIREAVERERVREQLTKRSIRSLGHGRRRKSK